MEENTKPSNPFAFPMSTIDGYSQDGMTLRDYFANSAMQGMVTNPQIKRPEESEREFDMFAKRAYRYADAMLKQREL